MVVDEMGISASVEWLTWAAVRHPKGCTAIEFTENIVRAWYFYGIDSSRRHSTFGQR